MSIISQVNYEVFRQCRDRGAVFGFRELNAELPGIWGWGKTYRKILKCGDCQSPGNSIKVENACYKLVQDKKTLHRQITVCTQIKHVCCFERTEGTFRQ